jgi:predicted GIY-YIG superfamily endonuclease
MVEQRPFKALVVGSSPTQPRSPENGLGHILRDSCGRHYIGSTENLERRLSEQHRGKVHSTRRFGQSLEVVASKEIPNIESARALERELKAKKNPQVAVYLLNSRD